VVADVALRTELRTRQHVGECPDARIVADLGALAEPLRVHEDAHAAPVPGLGRHVLQASITFDTSASVISGKQGRVKTWVAWSSVTGKLSCRNRSDNTGCR